MNDIRELETGITTDLPRALLKELDPDEWVPRYAVVLLDGVDERDKRIAELEAELSKLDSFDGCVILAEALLEKAYPKGTIVCSTDPKASIGAQVTGALRALIERIKAADNPRAEMAEAENAKLREGLRELGCDVIRAETSATLSTTREHLLSARSRINALLGKDGGGE